MTNIIIAFSSAIAIYLAEYFLGKPLIKFLERNSTKFSNGLYRQMAKSNLGYLSVATFGLVFLIIFIGSEYVVLEFGAMDAINSGVGKNLESKSLETLNYILSAIVIVINVFFFIFFIRQITILDNLVNYRHCLKIIKPLLSAAEFEKLEQKWALMETKEDYIKIKEQIKPLVEQAKETASSI